MEYKGSEGNDDGDGGCECFHLCLSVSLFLSLFLFFSLVLFLNIYLVELKSWLRCIRSAGTTDSTMDPFTRPLRRGKFPSRLKEIIGSRGIKILCAFGPLMTAGVTPWKDDDNDDDDNDERR